MQAQLLGQPVKHISFGKGIISGFSGNIVTVQFPAGEKKFLYPEAFLKFLTLKDIDRQAEVTEKCNEKIRSKRAKDKELTRNHEYMKKIHTMKITPNSQAAFDVSTNDAEKIIESGVLSTGLNLSGYSKGKPRIPSRLKPNSVCLITGLAENEKEIERHILGTFMVDDDFWGEDCSNGIVKSHDKYKAYIPAGVNLSYWNYFENNGSVPCWGKVSFKYFPNIIMQKILFDMTELLSGTNQESIITEFYQYFCQINRLSIKQVNNEEIL